MSDQLKWDQRYRGRDGAVPEAADVLKQNAHLLPATGVALDLACGLGANSILLAQNGLDVLSWDISAVAIETLQQHAQQMSLPIRAEVRDVIQNPPQSESVDVIVVSHFLVREMAETIMAALKPGGVLFYQTYCRQKETTEGPGNPDYLLADNELLTMFAGLKVRVYREEALLGQLDKGWRNRAMLVAEKAD